MALKHTFQSAKADGGDATLIQPSNWNADHQVDGDGLTMVSDTTVPAAPAAGKMVVFGKDYGGTPMLAFRPPTGGEVMAQPFFGGRKICYFSPVANSTSLVGAYMGYTPQGGTVTARTVASTNLFTSMTRLGEVSAATAGSRALFYAGAAYLWRGNAAGLGGFRCVFRFGMSDAATVANANQFVGLTSTSSVGAGSTEPSVVLNSVGVGHDSGETTLSIMHNDGSGTATKVALGVSFPSNTVNTDVYELVLFAAPNDSAISYQVTRLNTGDVASGSLTTNLPVSTVFMMPMFMRGNMSTALAVGLDVFGMYTETEA